MPLFVKDPEVDALAERLMVIKKVNKTEAVRTALANEIAREEAKPDLAEIAAEFCRRLKARSDPGAARPADKAFIDGLYE